MPIPPKIPEQSHYSIIKNSSEYLGLLQRGRIRILPEVAELRDGQTVVFKPRPQKQAQPEGESASYDAIIYCTGYEMRFPFFKDASLVPGLDYDQLKMEKKAGAKLLQLYKRVMHPYYPTLCFIGQLDTIGSLFNVGEMQARWVSKVWAGHAELPPLEVRLQNVDKMKKKIERRKPRYPLFINFPSYIDDLARMIDCLPCPAENAETHEKVKELVAEGPYLPLTFRLNGYKR